MRVAYVDTSALIALAFGEPDSLTVANRLRSFDRLESSNLLEAEFRAACRREGFRFDPRCLADVHWLLPDRPLASEIGAVLDIGYLRGADLWHLATALFAATRPRDMAFLTLDLRQQAVARELGFRV